METYLYLQINAVGIILLILMLRNLSTSRKYSMTYDEVLFVWLMILNIFVLFFDAAMWVLDGKAGQLARVCNYFVTVIYYLLNSTICLLWLIYTDYKIYEKKEDMLKRLKFYLVPAVISSILTLASIWNGWFFVIDRNNYYSRGKHFLLMVFLAFFYMLASFFVAFRNGRKNKNVKAEEDVHLMVFPVVIIVAATIQSLNYGISLIWICCALACANVYINIQNKEISLDYLTGLYNRRKMDRYLMKRLDQNRNNRLLYLILIDLDDFKQINDKYGHLVGDQALKETARLLRHCVKEREDRIGRIGGDEFLIAGETNKEADIIQFLTNIEREVECFNDRKIVPYQLSFSIGYSICQSGKSLDACLNQADQRMYEQKGIKKERKKL